MDFTCGLEFCVLKCNSDCSTSNALKVVLEIGCQDNRLDGGKARQLWKIDSTIELNNVVEARGIGRDALIDLQSNPISSLNYTKSDMAEAQVICPDRTLLFSLTTFLYQDCAHESQTRSLTSRVLGNPFETSSTDRI